MARKRFSRGGARRETLWASVAPVSTTIAAANGTALILSGNDALLALRPFTIVRTRLEMHVHSDQAATSEFQHVALGVQVVGEEAVDAGASSLATPFAEQGSDLWMVYEELMNFQFFGSTVGFNNNGVSRTIDSKAMRKVQDGYDVAYMLEASSLSAGLICTVSGRFLIKLH